jgi:hypothetical protein
MVRIHFAPAASQANSEAVRKLLRNVADGSGEALGFAALPSHPTDAGKPVIYDRQFIAKPEEEGGCAPSLLPVAAVRRYSNNDNGAVEASGDSPLCCTDQQPGEVSPPHRHY